MRRALRLLSLLALASGCAMPPAPAAAPGATITPPAQPHVPATPPPPPAEPTPTESPAPAAASDEEKKEEAPPRDLAEAQDDDAKKIEPRRRGSEKGPAAPGSAVATGATLPPAVVERIVQGHMHDVKRCRERVSGSGATPEGRLVLSITIDDRGAVTRAVATTSSVPVELSQCIATLARSWTFPPPDGGGTVVVSYPFTFSTKE